MHTSHAACGRICVCVHREFGWVFLCYGSPHTYCAAHDAMFRNGCYRSEPKRHSTRGRPHFMQAGGGGRWDTHSPQAVRQCRSPFHVRAGEFPNIRDCRARNMIYSVECQHLRRLTRIARWRIIFILYCSIERHSRGGHSRLRFVAPCSSSQ